MEQNKILDLLQYVACLSASTPYCLLGQPVFYNIFFVYYYYYLNG